MSFAYLCDRYYFAVVVCDSVATADYIYKTCDGIEFERSSNKLDLRFIPDSMEFKHPARDVATEVLFFYYCIRMLSSVYHVSRITFFFWVSGSSKL